MITETSKLNLICRAGFGQMLVLFFELVCLFFEQADEEEKWRRFIVIGLSNAIGITITVATTFLIPIPFVNIVLGWLGKELSAILISHYQQARFIPPTTKVTKMHSVTKSL